MTTIATASGEYGEYRFLESPDEVDTTYRFDAGGVKILFDVVEMDSARKEFTFSIDGQTVGSIEASVVPDRVEGALAVVSMD